MVKPGLTGYSCRPNLLLEAARQFEIALPDSCLLGNAVCDVRAAVIAGVQPVMVLTV